MALRPRKKSVRRSKHSRCTRCGAQMRKHITRCKRCDEAAK